MKWLKKIKITIIKTNIITNGYCIDNILKCDSNNSKFGWDRKKEYNKFKRKKPKLSKMLDIIKYWLKK
jgi:hypothetical protein